MNTLIIDAELKNLLPPLSEEEAAGLEESILKEGCLSPLIVWGNVLVDGHYRYAICAKHAIPFSVKQIKFENMEEAKLWAWQHQSHRRNLTPFQRGELALKLKSAIAAQAKARQGCRSALRQREVGQDPINTNKILGEFSGVSHDTIRKVEYLVSHADEDTKARLRRGDKGTSIHQEYNRLRLNDPVAPLQKVSGNSPEVKTICEEPTGTLFVRSDTTPEELAAFLVDHFPTEYVREIVQSLLKHYDKCYGNSATQHFLLKTCAEWID